MKQSCALQITLDSNMGAWLWLQYGRDEAGPDRFMDVPRLAFGPIKQIPIAAQLPLSHFTILPEGNAEDLWYGMRCQAHPNPVARHERAHDQLQWVNSGFVDAEFCRECQVWLDGPMASQSPSPCSLSLVSEPGVWGTPWKPRDQVWHDNCGGWQVSVYYQTVHSWLRGWPDQSHHHAWHPCFADWLGSLEPVSIFYIPYPNPIKIKEYQRIIDWYWKRFAHPAAKGITEDALSEDEGMAKTIATFRYIKCNFTKHAKAEDFLYETLCQALGFLYPLNCSQILFFPNPWAQAWPIALPRRQSPLPWIWCCFSRRQWGSSNLPHRLARVPFVMSYMGA